MIVLSGPAASGKSSLQDALCAIGNYKPLVSYTSRQRRVGEIDGIDYHFKSDAFFEENKQRFLEINRYNGWNYGTMYEDLGDDIVAVMTPSGMRALKRALPMLRKLHDVQFVYLNVPRRDRLVASLERGDDVDEAIRRNLSDVGMFDGIEQEVDYVLDNPGFKKSVDDLAHELLEKIGQ